MRKLLESIDKIDLKENNIEKHRITAKDYHDFAVYVDILAKFGIKATFEEATPNDDEFTGLYEAIFKIKK